MYFIKVKIQLLKDRKYTNKPKNKIQRYNLTPPKFLIKNIYTKNYITLDLINI